MKIGIFGGTFDPPHIGHQILGMEAYQQLSLDMLFWVPAQQPPHKLGKKITKVEIREKMVRAAIQHDGIFKLSRVDLDREGPHYVLDSMKIIRKEFPEDFLCFVMGGDSLKKLPTWHKPKDFVYLCDKIAVMHRVDEQINLMDIEAFVPGVKEKIEFINAPRVEISSNQIRQLIASGKAFRYYLPQDVYEIVLDEKLYIQAKH